MCVISTLILLPSLYVILAFLSLRHLHGGPNDQLMQEIWITTRVWVGWVRYQYIYKTIWVDNVNSQHTYGASHFQCWYSCIRVDKKLSRGTHFVEYIERKKVGWRVTYDTKKGIFFFLFVSGNKLGYIVLIPNIKPDDRLAGWCIS